MNYAMNMHPFWGQMAGPSMRGNSMQGRRQRRRYEGTDGPVDLTMASETATGDGVGDGRPDREGRPQRGRRRGQGRHSGSHRMDRPDDAFGPMFGPGGPFRGQRGRGGRRNRGDVRASVLLLLDEQPRHGYEILTELADRSDGAWRPSPGSIYPVLKSLAEEGLVRPEQEEGRRVFHLTDTGRELVGKRRESWGEPWLADAPTDPPGFTDLRKEARQLAGAVWQVAQAENEQHLHQTSAILAKARKSIYLMLAEDESDTDAVGTPTGEDPVPAKNSDVKD